MDSQIYSVLLFVSLAEQKSMKSIEAIPTTCGETVAIASFVRNRFFSLLISGP
jgi:hypothetical protein